MKIAPSTYYARKDRPASRRAVRDEKLVEEIHQVHEKNYSVFGEYPRVWGPVMEGSGATPFS